MAKATLFLYYSTCLYNPARHGRYGEVTDDADNEKHDVNAVACLDGKVRVILQCLNVVLQHQHLYLGKDGAEQVRDGQPEVNLYVPAEPLRQRGLESVPHRYGETQRSEYGEDYQEERPQHVYDQCGGLEQQFQQFTEEEATNRVKLFATNEVQLYVIRRKFRTQRKDDNIIH